MEENKFKVALKEMEKIKERLGIGEKPQFKGEWQEIEDKCKNLDVPGDMISGVLVDVEKGDYNNKNYSIEVSPTNIITIYGTTVLDRKMKQVLVGEMVRITFLGEKEGKKGKYKDFKVETKK